MAKANTLVFITFLLSCLAVHTVYSCSCMPSHPQDQYCRADFVIRARVVDHRFVYVEDEIEESEEDSVEVTTELKEAPITRLPTVLPTVPPKEDTWDEEKDFDNEIPNEIPLERFRKSIMPLPPLSDVEDEIAEMGPREPLAQAWKVRITKIYKGGDFLDREERVELFTAPYDGLCGVTLDKSVHYILSGSNYDNKLRINACGLTMDFERLTSRQKQGFSSGYSKGCTQCRIAPCFGTCRESPSTCSWFPFGASPDCEGLYSKCLQRKSGECGWHKNKNYKACTFIRKGE